MKESFMNVTNMETSRKTIKIFFLILISLLLHSSINSYENKIIFKVENSIITTVDLENEIKYLLALNPSLKNLSKKEIIEISKRSILKEKIKEIEISNKFKEATIPQEFLEKLLKNIYIKIGIKNLDDFKRYINEKNINYINVLKKIEIEALWNELIFAKFSAKIIIDKDKLKEKVYENKTREIKSYLMSEIFFEISETEKLEKKYREISESINSNGFSNTALKYSISETANVGGMLDWINENSLNQKIKTILSSKKINDYTEPITVPGGFLILKVNDIKILKYEKNLDFELKKIIKDSENSQLNQFSKIYFNKVKNDMEINEI